MAHERTLLWIGCSGCSGETQALLGVEGQALDLVDLIDVDGLRCCGIRPLRNTICGLSTTTSWPVENG